MAEMGLARRFGRDSPFVDMLVEKDRKRVCRRVSGLRDVRTGANVEDVPYEAWLQRR